MKAFIFAFAVLFAGSNAVPQNLAVTSADLRLVTDAISSAIEDFSQSLRDDGYDPFFLEREVYSYFLPVPVIFSAEAVVEKVTSTGISNIVINRLNYGVVTSRLSFDLSLPLVDGSVENVDAWAMVFGSLYEAKCSGKIAIKEVRVVGQVQVNVGIISGISVTRINLDLTLGGIDPDITLKVFGYDLSDEINYFLSNTIPETMETYRAEINELLEIYALVRINELL